MRISSEVDGTKTLLPVDENSPTGYAQILEELDSALAVIRSYTLGPDVLAQAESTGEVYYFLYDGHGSVRALLDTSGLIIPGQIYRFDAYGNPIGFDPAAAFTGLLYSGELYDSQLQLQYLRARWYDLSTGAFNRLDPFFGNLQDPQSLHKYAYAHGDPVMASTFVTVHELRNHIVSTPCFSIYSVDASQLGVSKGCHGKWLGREGAALTPRTHFEWKATKILALPGVALVRSHSGKPGVLLVQSA